MLLFFHFIFKTLKHVCIGNTCWVVSLPPPICCREAVNCSDAVPVFEKAALHTQLFCWTYTLWQAFCWCSGIADRCRGYSTQTGSTSPLWCFSVQLPTGNRERGKRIQWCVCICVQQIRGHASAAISTQNTEVSTHTVFAAVICTYSICHSTFYIH